MRNVTHVLHQKKQTKIKDNESVEGKVWAPIIINSKTKNGMKQRRVIAETVVSLFDEKEWRQVLKEKKDDDPYPADILTPESCGISLCSEKDQYSRKVGLAIATARALDRYDDETCPVCVNKKKDCHCLQELHNTET